MKRTRKIAIMGSAPSSVLLAPFDDPSYEIWGCSPGLYPVARRMNVWFEIHKWEPTKPWFSPEYRQYMAKLNGPVFTIEVQPEIPNSRPFPIGQVLDYVYAKHLVPVFDGMAFEVDQRSIVHIDGEPYVWVSKRFDRSDFSSTIAWMIALAIMEGAKEIGLWGVDMSATEEWFFQRSGCQSLIDIAKSLGIKVTVPPESDIMRPPPLYGFCEIDPAHAKYVVRRDELIGRRNAAIVRGQTAQREVDHLNGAIEDLEYHRFTWIGNPFHLSQNFHTAAEPIIFSPAPAVPPVAPIVSDPGVAGGGKGNGEAAANAFPGVDSLQTPGTANGSDADQENWRKLETDLAAAGNKPAALLTELSTALGISDATVNGELHP